MIRVNIGDVGLYFAELVADNTNTNTNLAVNKNLHTLTSCWISPTCTFSIVRPAKFISAYLGLCCWPSSGLSLTINMQKKFVFYHKV